MPKKDSKEKEAAAKQKRREEAEIQLTAEMHQYRFRFRNQKVKSNRYKMRTNPILKRQKYRIASLAAERERIGNSEPNDGDIKHIANYKHDLNKHTTSTEGYNKQCQQEMMQSALLDREIKTLTKEFCELTKTQKHMALTTSNPKKLMRKKEGLEDTIESLTHRLGEQIEHNGDLRSEIKTLRTVKKTFGKIHDDIMNDINGRHDVIKDVTLETQNRFEERDEEWDTFIALQHRNKKDLVLYREAHTDLSICIKANSRLARFMTTKLDKRQDWKDIEKEKRAKCVSGHLNIYDRPFLDAMDHSIRRIKDLTGCRDFIQMLTLFDQMEENRFGLFSYVNELNTQRKSLAAELERKRIFLEENNNAMAKATEEVKQKQQQVEEVRRVEVENHKLVDAQLANLTQNLDHVTKVVGEIFKKLNCSSNILTNNFERDVTVTINNNNITHFLKEIDICIGDITMIYYYREYSKPDDSTKSDGSPSYNISAKSEPPARRRSRKLSETDNLLQIPCLADEDCTIDIVYNVMMENMPMSTDELRALVTDEIMAKEGGTYSVKRKSRNDSRVRKRSGSRDYATRL